MIHYHKTLIYHFPSFSKFIQLDSLNQLAIPGKIIICPVFNFLYTYIFKHHTISLFSQEMNGKINDKHQQSIILSTKKSLSSFYLSNAIFILSHGLHFTCLNEIQPHGFLSSHLVNHQLILKTHLLQAF